MLIFVINSIIEDSFCIFATDMRQIVNILAILFIGAIVVALDGASEQQSNKHLISQQLEVEITESYPPSLLNIITSRKNSNSPTARRIHSEHKHSKVYCGFACLNISIPQIDFNHSHRHTQQHSLSLVYKLCNLRI